MGEQRARRPRARRVKGRQKGWVIKWLDYIRKGSWEKGSPAPGLEKFRVVLGSASHTM